MEVKDVAAISESIWCPPFKVSEEDRQPVLGIDFGTSNSVAGLWLPHKNCVEILSTGIDNSRVLPSAVAFGDSWEDVDIGGRNASNGRYGPLIRGVKNVLGLTSRPPHAVSVSSSGEELPSEFTVAGLGCRISERSGGEPYVGVCVEDGKGNRSVFPPENIAALTMRTLRDSAEKYLTENYKNFRGAFPQFINQYKSASAKDSSDESPSRLSIRKVVLGIPAISTNAQKEALRRAAQQAGFTEISFLVESTAAALSYGLLVAGEKKILVVDVGGGTTDLTFLQLTAHGTATVLTTFGCRTLGGQDIDLVLLQLLWEKLSKEWQDKSCFGVSWQSTQKEGHELGEISESVRGRLLEHCRKCKETLTISEKATIQLTAHDLLPLLMFSGMSASEVRNLQKTETLEFVVSRQELEKIMTPLLDLLHATLRQGLKQFSERCNLQKRDGCLQEVVLVGGSSRIPAIRERIRFALGEFGLSQFSPGGVGELCTSVEAEEVVAEGLAIRGAIVSGEDSHRLRSVLMLDCLPTTVGLLVRSNDVDREAGEPDEYFEPVLEQGMTYPCARSVKFQLADPQQTCVTLKVYEELTDLFSASENELNHSYEFLLSTDVMIERLPTDNSSWVEVTLSVDEDSTLRYSAKIVSDDLSTKEREVAMKNAAESASEKQTRVLVTLLIVLIMSYILAKIAMPNFGPSAVLKGGEL